MYIYKGIISTLLAELELFRLKQLGILELRFQSLNSSCKANEFDHKGAKFVHRHWDFSIVVSKLSNYCLECGTWI